MRRICGKKLTLAVVASLLAGTVPAWAADVTGQQVTIDKDRTESLLCGGYTTSGNASRNTLFVTGSASITADEGAGGGYAEAGEAIGNQVNFSSSGSHQIEVVFGGYGRTKASENQVSTTNGKFDSQLIYGGFSESAADNNKVSIGGTVDITLTSDSPEGDGIYGGYVEGTPSTVTSTAKGNQVFFSGGTVRGAEFIAGGYADNVMDNHVSITGGKLENNMVTVGGYGSTLAQGNVVSVDGKTDISALGLAGGYAETAESNRVSIGQDAAVTSIAVGGVVGVAVSHNLVDVKGTVTSYLLGGAGTFGGQSSDVASGNVLNLNGAKLIPIQKEKVLSMVKNTVDDGYEEDVNEIMQQLKNPGETIQVAGGALMYGGKAQDNMVNLSGTMNLSQADLYGWLTPLDIAQDPSYFQGPGGDGETNHSGNTLNVGYTAELSTDQDGKTIITGEAADWHGSKVRGICNFDKIAFYNVDYSQPALAVTDTVSLPDNVTLNLDHFASADGGQVLKDDVLIDASGAATVKGLDKLYESGKDKYQQTLTQMYADGGVEVTGKAGLSLSDNNILSYGLRSLEDITYKTIDWQTDGTVLTLADSRKFDLANTKVHTENIGFTAKSLENITKAGDYSMTLLDTQGNKTLAAGNLTTKQGKWNISNALEGTGVASLDANGNVIYTMDTVQKKNGTEIKVDTSKQTHNALIANEAALGVLAAGRDRLDSVLTNFNGQEKGGFTFASLGGSKDTYDTGSESKTYTWNGLVGIGNEAATKDGDFSYGLFYEYGRGHYSVDGAGYAGSGDAHYNGGGLMAKYLSKNKNYVEGSLHFGNLKNNADSVLHSSDGSAYGYNTSSSYWSGHVGFGHIFDLTDKVESTSLGGTQRAARDLDVYGKYFYTHVGGDSFLAGEANYQLDGMNSSLLRIGARVNNRSGWNNYYYGLAWDYEFDGESNGTVSAAGLSSPIRKADIGGSSLMAEAGWKLESNQENPWEVNLSMQAYAGQHKGLGGNVYMAYHF
ncbi:autotransporter outer membrane beta-barrel domain-containing protein [Mitsuokella sp. AF33-22]|uniref:autotransporter outer membrane beta-barrel domain-containing protein n=1 Tax=Mitsuokella sp. AF33-22 TaxID=2292047 RepID=UPI0011C39AD6|nr:autotransporter outer membrane beta-barrel domain-containing protein [Mitsuokella sp. AF33-22]